MKLWVEWMSLVNTLRPAFSRQRTFYWMIVVLIGFTIKSDFSGVTSLARGAGILPNYYTCMLHLFASSAVNLSKLQALWVDLVFKKFTMAVKINGRHVILGDGIKVGKEGKKMPGVKSLHQDSQSNTKPEYIMGHSIQVVSLVVCGLSSFFSVPLSGQIHEGIRYNCQDKRTQLDKMCEMLISLDLPTAFYFIADRYYCSGRLLKQLIAQGIHLVTRMKNRSVAYHLPEAVTERKRGRPKKYGEKVKLIELFNDESKFIEAPMPGDEKVTIKYYSLQLLWKPISDLVQFILVIHPVKGKSIFLSSDLALEPLSAIKLYSLRFKIEVMFKQALHQIGTFMYHFWLKCMRLTKRGSGDWLLHFSNVNFKLKVQCKIQAYHLFMMLGFIAQGLMQYLAICHSQLVWSNFGSWLRTIRPGIPASEKVVSIAMSQSYPEFIADSQNELNFKKFLRHRIEPGQFSSGSFDEKAAA